MRVIFLLVSVLMLSSRLFADADEYYGPYRFNKGSVQTVFSDTAYIRNAASGSAAAMDSMYAYESVTIVKQLQEQLTLGRKTAPWYQVSFMRAGSARLGYLWGGALALKSLKHQGAQFMAGLLSYPDAAAFSTDDSAKELRYMNTFSIKAKSPTARDEVRFNISRESQYFYEETDSNGVVTDKHWQSSKGIPAGTSFLLHFGMSGEACGIPSYTITAAWNGVNLIRLPLIESNADGGEWSYNEEFVFPAQKGGKSGMLRVRSQSETAIEGSENMKTEVSWRSYRFDAATRQFVRLPAP